MKNFKKPFLKKKKRQNFEIIKKKLLFPQCFLQILFSNNISNYDSE